MTPEAFAVEAAELHLRLVRIAYSLCGDRELAAECAQEALARAWQRVDRGAPLDSLEAWTTRVALNWCHSQLRRRGAESRALGRLDVTARGSSPGGGADAGATVDRTDALSADVHRAVLDLPYRQREVVVLHYLLDYDIAHIARLAGISQGAVKNALFHGRARLAQRLGTPAPSDDPLGDPEPAVDHRATGSSAPRGKDQP